MDENIDEIARNLLNGSLKCDSCTALNELIVQVKNNQINFEEFKRILTESKEQYLRNIM
jgi:hypothetical protein